MKCLRMLLVLPLMWGLVACQTSEKRDFGERLQPTSTGAPAPEDTSGSGPTLYGTPAVPTKHAPCSNRVGDDLQRGQETTLDIGVKADVVKKKLKNPRPYTETNCVP